MKLRQGPPGGATVEHVPVPPPCPKCPGVSPHGLRRRNDTPCRKLRPFEIKRLKADLTITYQSRARAS